MIWVEAEDIILIHSRIVQVSGGSAGASGSSQLGIRHRRAASVF